MKKKIFILLCILIVVAGAYCGFNISFDVEETETIAENVIEEVEIEETEETNEVIITQETEEIVRDTIQSTIERRGFKHNRGNRKHRRRGAIT